MQHNCTICNAEFESKSSRAKYCLDCRKLSKKQREAKAAEIAAVVEPVAVPEYKAPDVVPEPEVVEEPTAEPEPVKRDSGRRVCNDCGAEYTVKHGRGGCPMCALDRHFGIRKI